jgi:hypothetical protein
MATTYADVEVVCPFFREQAAVTVTCEGPTDNTKVKLLFYSKNQKDIYMQLRCCGAYHGCRLAKMAEGKYEE